MISKSSARITDSRKLQPSLLDQPHTFQEAIFSLRGLPWQTSVDMDWVELAGVLALGGEGEAALGDA